MFSFNAILKIGFAEASAQSTLYSSLKYFTTEIQYQVISKDADLSSNGH